MPTISLTDFVDFAIKSGTPKLTKVREVKNRHGYEPALDYWKHLREGIQDFHRKAGTSKAALDDILRSLQNPKKLGRYSAAIKGYKKFIGRKNIQWFEPLSSDWSYEDLS